MTEYPDASHPSYHWTVQALYPPLGNDATAAWRAVFFDSSKEGATRSMAWALDQDEGTYARALDFRVVPPALERPTAGAVWEPLAARRRAAKSAASAAREAEERAARLGPKPEPSRAAATATATPRATVTPRARAADRFRRAVKR